MFRSLTNRLFGRRPVHACFCTLAIHAPYRQRARRLFADTPGVPWIVLTDEPDDFADGAGVVFAVGAAAGVFVLSAAAGADAAGANAFKALSLAAVLTSFDFAGGAPAPVLLPKVWHSFRNAARAVRARDSLILMVLANSAFASAAVAKLRSASSCRARRSHDFISAGSISYVGAAPVGAHQMTGGVPVAVRAVFVHRRRIKSRAAAA